MGNETMSFKDWIFQYENNPLFREQQQAESAAERKAKNDRLYGMCRLCTTSTTPADSIFTWGPGRKRPIHKKCANSYVRECTDKMRARMGLVPEEDWVDAF